MRVLFCPLASHGFIYPMIGMARLLARRGHSAAFATDESFAQELERCGCERIPRGRARDGASFLVSRWAEPYCVAIQVKHLEYAVERFQPELLVGQPLTLGPMICAERSGLSLALLGFCTYHWPRSREALENPSNVGERLLSWRIREWTEIYNAARQLFKMTPVEVDVLETPALGDRFLVRSVAGFGIGDHDVPPRVEFVGDCLWEPEVDDLALESWFCRARDSGKPIVYLQHGRFFDLPDFWSSFKAAAEGEGLWVAVSTSRMDRETGELPQNFFARPFLPQGRVLHHADLIVTAGNTTAVLGAVTAGVPALLIPGGGEQPDVAAWCELIGMAKVLSPPQSVTSKKILDGMREVIGDSSYRRHAGLMQSQFCRYKGFERAVSALEELGRVSLPGGGSK